LLFYNYQTFNKYNNVHFSSLVSEADRQKCSDLLGGDDSGLMPCYTTVDVSPFQRMCISDAAKEAGTGKYLLSSECQFDVYVVCLKMNYRQEETGTEMHE
jgi:hypothetical protein